MDEKLKQLLQDYVSTANSGKYKTMDEVHSKFPELKDYSIDLLNDYVATANSGKYSSIDEVNARFPEFGPKQAEVSPQGSGLTSQELGEPTTNTSNPDQNLGPQGQNTLGTNGSSLDQSLLAQNNATNLNDVIAPEGTQIVEGVYNEYGLPVYANRREDGTYDQGGSFLEPVELKANRSQAMAQNQRIAAEDLSTWESTKNSFKNMYKQLQGFDKRLTIMSADIYKKVLGKDLAKSFYELSDRDIDQEIATAYQQLDAINESMNPTLGFTDGDAIAGVANAVTSFASTALSSAATLGAGLVTEMVGGSLYDYNKAKAESLGVSVEELYKQGKEDFWTPAAVGAASSALERIGLKGATRAIMTNITGKTARQFAILGWEVNKEGMTEWIQTGLSAYNEAIAQGKSQAEALNELGYAMGSKEGLESYLQGLAGSAAATAGGRVAKGFINKSKGQKVSDNNSKIQSLLVDYANSNDPAIKETLLDTAVELVEGNSALESENVAEIEAVPQNVRAEVVSSQMEIDALNEAVETGNVSDSSKAAIEAKVQDLESNKEAIIKENTVGTTVKDAISKPDGRYILDGEDGTISVDEGGKVTFETENKVVELGNVDSVSDNDLSSFGIDVEREIPVFIDGNKINIDGVEYVNNFSDPASAINRDSDGRVISINLETPDGKKRTIRGQRADAIAYEYQNLQNENIETEIQSDIIQEDSVVPVESNVEQEAVATQEVVEPNVEINETAVETVTPEVGVQNQNVAIEPEQVTQVETNPEVNEVQENTIQENEQTEVRAEAEQESPASTEMPDVDQTNPRLKSVIKSIPNQDINSLIGPDNVEKRRDVIEAITGKRPSKNEAGINATRKAVDDYFGLTGDNASKASKLRNWTNFEQTEFSNEEEAGIYQIRNTEDPNEILDIYDTDVDNLDYKESAIADYVGKINLRDYGRYGDLNNLQGNRSLQRWVDSKNTQTVGLDVMAEELSDQIGVEVTPQDFIDFIESYSSAKDFLEANKSNVKIEAENRYKELTGRNITENALERRRASRSEESSNTRREAVNRENMAAIGVTDTEVADRQNMESEQEKVAKQREKRASDKTPVSLLDGVSQRLKQTGLAKSVKLMSSEDIEADLSGRNGVQFQADQSERLDIESKAKADGTWMKAPNGKPSNLNEQQWVSVRTKAFKDWFGDWENDPANASKVVDKNGEPKVVYHGSPYGGINEFDQSKKGKVSSGLREYGSFFTTNKQVALMYANQGQLSAEIKKDLDDQINDLYERLNETRNNRDYDAVQSEIDKLYAERGRKLYETFLNIRNPFSFDGEGLDERGWSKAKLNVGYKTATGKADVLEALSGNNSAYKNTQYDGVIANNLADFNYGVFGVDPQVVKDAVKDKQGDTFFIWGDGQIKSATDNVGTYDSSNNDIRYQKKDDQNLVVLHNISANNLLKSLKAGGLPAPSLAVTSKENSFDSYGDITLITPKETIDPKSNKKNKIYSADAYTPRYPSVSYITKNGAVSKALSSYYNSLPNELSSSVSYAIENDIESKGLQGLLESRDAMLLYANSVNPDVVVRKYDDKKHPKETVDYISSLDVYDYLDTADIPGARQKIAELYVKDRVNQGREESYVRERFIDEKGELNFNLAKQFFNEIKSAIKQSGKPDYRDSKNNAFDYISENNLQSDFESAMKEVYEKVSPEEKIFKGFSPSGNKMYTSNTPENALKLMKKEGFVGTENFFSGGPAAARARLAPVFKSINDVKSKRDRIVSNEGFKSIADEINEKYWSVSNDIIEKYANDRSVDSSSFSYDILDLVKNGKSYNFNQLSKEDVLRVKDLADTLANAPTEYFEAKPERVVGMNEFAHAVIPKNTPLDVRRALEQSGIPYTEYTDSKNRGEVVRSVSDSNGLSFQKGSGINGYVDNDGNIVINRDTAGLDTPIHEFGHIWVDKMKNENPGLYQQGMDLIKSAEGDDYVLHVMETQPHLQGDAIYEEALVQAIGDSGARLIKTQERSKITEWLKAAWDYIGGLVGISGKTPEQIANMTLREYTDGVAIDLLSGKPIQTSPSGDIFVKMDNVSTEDKKVSPTPVTKASDMNVDQKKIAAFMEKMRLRNTVKYQGTVDPSSLSDSDLVEFIDVAQSLMNLGQVQSYSDLKDFASSLGIENESQIKFVWNSVNQKKVLGIKKSLVDPKKVLETKYDKLSDAEYLEMGKQMVDSGLIVPSELLSDVLTTGRVLEPYEVTALIYGRTLDQKRIDELGVMITTLEGDELSNARVEMEALFDKIADYETMMLMTATAQSAAFRLRSVMTDKEYNVQRYIAEMEAMGELSPDVRAELEALGREMESVKSELRNKVAELEDLKKKQSQTNINKAAKKKTPPVPKPKSTAKKNEYTKDALDIIAGLNVADYGLPGISFQMNGNVKFSINSSNPLIDAIQDALRGIEASVSSKNLRLDDAIEEGIKLINAKVGKGNWNEIKFRSDILNQYVDKGHVVAAKRPYVGTDGKLVVPTAYLKEIVADYQSNNSGEMSIEDMVDAVMDEVGPGFNRRDALEAVSRFGIVSANTRSEEIANIQRARTIGNLLAELEDLEKGIPRRLKKKAGPKNTRAEELRKQIHDIEESMRMTPEERAQMRQDKALEAKKRYMKEYIDKIDNKIANKDFEPEVKTPLYDFSNNPDIIDLEKRREDIKNKFKAAKFKHKLENRTPGEKLGDLAIDVFFNTTRALSAGTDISSFLVQGGLITFSNPVASAKSLKKSMGVVKSEESFDDYFAGLQRDPLFEAARKAKLNMQLPNFYQSVVEEQIPGGQNLVVRGYDFLVDKFVTNKNIAKKLKDWFPMTAAERQYAVFLSDIRFNMFKQVSMDAINYQGLDVTSKEGQGRLAEIADAVNNITMAANIKTLDGATKIQKYLNLVLFSARKLAATMKLLYKIPYYGVRKSQNIVGRITGNASLSNKTEFDTLIFDKVYGQAAKGLANMAAVVIIPTLLANWSYDDDEDEEPPLLYNPHVLNPIHSDFLKMKIGDTRYSPFLGIEGNIGLISRLVSGQYMTSSSSQVLKTGEKSPNGMGENKSELDLVAQFLKNKLAPSPSIVLGYFGNSRERREAGSRFVESFAPMWSTGIYEDVTENNKPMSEALAYGALGILGMSFNTYGGAEYASAKGTDNKEAYNIMRKVGISDYIPDARDKKSGMYDNGSYIAELDNKKFKDEYVPAYNEFMTKSTIVNGSKLLGDKLSIDSKDGLLLQMKKEAYNYAELKSTGVIVDSYFNTFNHTDDEGVSTKYKITRAQYPEKVSMIKNILAGKDDDYLIDSYVKQDIRDEVIAKMDKDGLKRDKDYINMQVEIQLFRLANRYANEKLAENFKPGKYIPSQSYDPNVHEEEQFRD